MKVPAGARPGLYTGTLTVRTAGESTLAAPVEVKVAPWTLPDPVDYRTWVDIIQSPDTLAMEYGVDLWSAEHWKLIERSLKLMGEAGNKTLYVPLIAHTNLGNAETMVRWIETGEDACRHDFSIMEKLLPSCHLVS